MEDSFTLMERLRTRRISVGGVPVGGGAPVSVQSMCSTPTRDAEATLAQIDRLAAAGCDIVRVAVPDEEAARALERICAESPLPVVADIHFDYRLALASAKAGAAKIRINPGNIGGEDNVRAVAEECGARGLPIRIGVNSGSIEKRLLERYGGPTPEAMVESAAGQLALLECFGFRDVCVSLKASDVPTTVAAYRMASERFDCPLHLGVTEAGTSYNGVVASAVGIGTLLCEGLGDTLRVSLTAPPEEEVRAGIAILKAAGLRRGGVHIVSCPTCGRTQIDLISLATEVENRLAGLDAELTVAVMGCIVNGPGEAREADYGIAGGRGEGVLFKKGRPIGKVTEAKLVDALCGMIEEETRS
ncbi:MAG: flavodoxin-dependent (E)-4-hydroxy-3-methylbut-2-enyl-diphosphate synthase [Oscillospiraceae bacterium]|nr:flavodoxin-dependent (E)-4-hydroxy-3-methylbut-2-enyl-diphosphate synthase [Oscillospiraceae bacterium]